MSILRYLRQRIRELEERLPPPTRNDIRAKGVTKTLVLKYMKQRDWRAEVLDTGDTRSAAWDKGPPRWLHPEYIEIEYWDDPHAINALASREARSPWAVLNDIAELGEWRDIYDPDGETIIARERGSQIMEPLERQPLRIDYRGGI